MRLSKSMTVLALMAGFLLSGTTCADGASAVAAMYRNMASIGIGWDVKETNAHATPTLVRGIYKLVDRSSNQFLGYLNEGGTALGDHRGWKVWARPPRPMNGTELAELRGELLRNIDVDKLIKVEYGDGGGRQMILFSAVDCPYCKKFETAAAKLAASMNTTFYVVPSALRPTSYGTAPWRTVTNIWCAKDNASAWRAYWSSGSPPSAAGCRFDEYQAEEMANQLSDLLSSVGIKTGGVPKILREDGSTFTPQPGFDKHYAASNFGRDGLSGLKPGYDQGSAKWLVASAALEALSVNMDSTPSNPISTSANPTNDRKTFSIDLGGSLKKIFQ